MKILFSALAALAAGFIQGIAGFGSGPVQMMVYPLFWSLPEAAAVSVCVSVPLNLNMMLTYWKRIDWKKVLLPVLPYMAVCTVAIRFSKDIDQAFMKKVFGGFLILLAVYYLFFDRREKRKLSLFTTLVYIAVSAVCDAFFGIGGPLMVLYFLSITDSQEEYLGTAAAFFLINGAYNTAVRLMSGIIGTQHVPYICAGIAAILLGVTAAHRLVDRLDDALLRKVTYVMIGLTGVFNLIA